MTTNKKTMNILKKLFHKKQQDNIGGIEDFMLLIRVYFQASIASQTGINNIAALPDLRVFKQTYHVAAQNNKLGLGEKKLCKKMLQSIYGSSDGFFKEIEDSIKKKCHKPQDIQPYLLKFQGFSQEIMMLMGNLMQWKFRLPLFFRKAMHAMVEKQVHEILTRDTWKDEAVRRACISVRKYQAYLSYSESWMTEYVHTVIMLAKKEKSPQNK